MKESDFQSKLIKKLKERYEGCIILKNDPTYIQGIPDLLILYKDKWAMLETKKSRKANKQPNQKYYISKAANMSFGKFIYPENEKPVLRKLDEHFRRKK